jgi:hypothetical protein
VFSSLFYILILIFQSFYAESNFSYNQQIRQINDLVSHRDFRNAYQQITKLEEKSVFTNNDLTRMRRNLALKVRVRSADNYDNPRTLNDFVINSLSIYKNKNYNASMAFCKSIIVDQPVVSDSLIKLFEILAFHAPLKNKTKPQIKQQTSFKNMRLNEAMNLLDLMKRKEKTLF